MKVTDAHRGNLKKELEIIQQMRRATMTNLPRELSVYLNEDELHFVMDEMIAFVRKADMHNGRVFTTPVVSLNIPEGVLFTDYVKRLHE